MKVRAHRCCHPELQSLWLGLDNEICHQPFTLLAGQGHGAITAPGTRCVQSRATTECSWLLLLPCRAQCLQVLLLLPLVPSEPFPALWGRSPVPLLSFYLGFGFSDSRGSLAAGEV